MTARPEIYGNTATANTISVPGSGPAPSSAPTPVASKKQAPKKKTATSSASVSVSVGPRKGVQLSLKSKTSQSEHSASIYPGKKRQLLKPVAAVRILPSTFDFNSNRTIIGDHQASSSLSSFSHRQPPPPQVCHSHRSHGWPRRVQKLHDGDLSSKPLCLA